MKKILMPLMALILFTGFTAYSMLSSQESLLDFGARLMSSLDTAQVVIDLYILGAMACVWMYRDNRDKGNKVTSVLPYFLITAFFVSIGPLLYLVVNAVKTRRGDTKI